jgi:hypothetical protein
VNPQSGHQGNQANRSGNGRDALEHPYDQQHQGGNRNNNNNQREESQSHRQEDEVIPPSILRHDDGNQGAAPRSSRQRQRANRRRGNQGNQTNRMPPSDPNPPFIEELPDEESSAPPETPVANHVNESEIDPNDGALLAYLHSVSGQETDAAQGPSVDDEIPTAQVTPMASAQTIPSDQVVTIILPSDAPQQTYPNDHYELSGEAERLTLMFLEDPEDFDFGRLDELSMRMRITVAISLAWHMMAVHNSVNPLHHEIFVNEIAIFLQWEVLEDMIVKDHVSRRIFRELKDLPRIVMDEFQLSPMKYAHLMLPAITFRSLNAPTVRPSTYHTLFEAYVNRFYPDHWPEILRAVLSQHMTPAIFMRLAQTDGGFARWLRDESGVAYYHFNPPRINNLTELQETIDLAREEALDSMSRSSLPNLDYYPQDNSPSRLVGHTQGSPLVFGMLHRRTARMTGLPTNDLPINQTAPASLLALILQEKSSTLSAQSVGYSMRQIEEEFLAPQTALIAGEGLEPSTDPFSHQRGNYANLETLNQGCLSFGPVVLDNQSLLLEDINSLFLVEDLPFHRIPNSPPMELADNATRQSLQRLQTHDFWAVLTKKVVIPFLDLYCPSARYQVLRNMIFHSHHDALQIFSVPSQFVRRLRNMGIWVLNW